MTEPLLAVDDERVLACSEERVIEVPELSCTAQTSDLARQIIIRAAIRKVGARKIHSPRTGIMPV